MSWADGFASSFGDLGTAIKHLFTGHTPEAQQDVVKANDNVQANMDANGGSYSVVDSLVGLNVKDTLDWLVIGVFALLIYAFVFKD